MPTFGLIGRAGIIPHSWSLDHAGPLTSSVADAALLTQVMAGHDPDDASSVERVPINLVDACDEPVEGLTVGVCRNHFFDSIDDDVSQTVENIINKLSASGAVIRDFTVPELAYGLGAIYAIELASSTAYHRKRLAKGIVENFQPDVRLLVEMGSLVSGVDYLQAERYRTLLGEKFKDAFAKIDVVLSPTMPLTAWEIGQRSVNLGKSAESVLAVSWRLTYPWNLLGLPGNQCSLRCRSSRTAYRLTDCRSRFQGGSSPTYSRERGINNGRSIPKIACPFTRLNRPLSRFRGNVGLDITTHERPCGDPLVLHPTT